MLLLLLLLLLSSNVIIRAPATTSGSLETTSSDQDDEDDKQTDVHLQLFSSRSPIGSLLAREKANKTTTTTGRSHLRPTRMGPIRVICGRHQKRQQNN